MARIIRRRRSPASRNVPVSSIRQTKAMLRCLIVDDSSQFLAAARRLLERQGITVVGVASTADKAVDQAAELQPDVVLVDIDLGGESGFEVARQLQGAAGADSFRVILISAYAEEDYADLIAASSAVGFLPKTTLSGQHIRELVHQSGHNK
jgi:DNA-binding NarL/FixJ family response regulator